MKDTFGNEIEIGSIVLYCVKSMMGSEYNIGKIVKYYETKFHNINRVEIEVIKGEKKLKNPVVYACNVVAIKDIMQYCEQN